MQSIKNFWNSLSPAIQSHITTAVRTFLATFGMTLVATVQNGQFNWTGSGALAILVVALNAGFKAVQQQFFPPSLGGLPK